MAFRVQLIDVVKRYGPVLAVDSVTWNVEAGAVLGLVGSSGAGKTTLLRLIAGLESSSDGQVVVSGPQPGVTTHTGQIGMVFQNLALWPHLSARKHLECVLAATPRRQRRSRAEALLSKTRVPRSAWDRLPGELSGGEKQRLAIARALAPEPQLLLLDEPLAHVDPELKAELLDHLQNLLGAKPVTVIYVTHTWSEASATCQSVAVMNAGRLEQEGTPEQLFWQPANLRVARLTGPVIAIPLRLLRDGWLASDVANERGLVAGANDSDTLAVRPQQMSWIAPNEQNQWIVMNCTVQGTGWLVTIERENVRLAVASAQPVQIGQAVGVELKLAMPAALRAMESHDTKCENASDH